MKPASDATSSRMSATPECPSTAPLRTLNTGRSVVVVASLIGESGRGVPSRIATVLNVAAADHEPGRRPADDTARARQKYVFAGIRSSSSRISVFSPEDARAAFRATMPAKSPSVATWT